MVMTKIPDIAYEIDGDYINLEQDAGCGEVHYVQIHKLHMRHLAELSGIVAEQREFDAEERKRERIKDELLDLHSGMKWLYEYLDSVPCYPPGSEGADDVIQARWVLEQIEAICDLVGAEIVSVGDEVAQHEQSTSISSEPAQLPLA